MLRRDARASYHQILEVTQSIATETLENTSSMLNKVAGKLSTLKNDDDVFSPGVDLLAVAE